MPSSSKHDTSIEKQIQHLCILVYARLATARVPTSVLDHMLGNFLEIMDIDVKWLHKVLWREACTFDDQEETEQIAELRCLVDELVEQGQTMRRSALFTDVANACYAVSRLLKDGGRGKEAMAWLELGTECQIDAEAANQDEDVHVELGELRC